MSPLERALHEVSRHIELGHLNDALRFADRARRLAPADPSLLLIQGTLLLQLGLPLRVLELIPTSPLHDGLAALRAEALCLLDDDTEAWVCCRRLLAAYAVDAFPNIGSLAGRLVRLARSDCPGWIGLCSDLSLVGEARDGGAILVLLGRQPIPLEFTPVGADGFAGFRGTLPLDAPGMIGATGAGLRDVLGTGLPWPPEFRLSGWAVAGATDVVGEAQIGWAPHWPVPVLLRIGPQRAIGPDEAPFVDASVGPEFVTTLPATPAPDARVEVRARLPDGRLMSLPQGVARLSDRPLVAATPPSPAGKPPHALPRPIVDVVIPVHGAPREALRCLRSVLASLDGTAAEIIVVDDAGPADAELTAALDDWAAAGAITLLTNAVNMGFPGAANRGMALHGDRDVVLLNSDTEVFADWLVRLRRAAYAAATIGTVTPLGGRASIASYPDPDADVNPGDARRIDALAARVNAGCALDVPVGVGFCLYIKRTCLNAVGLFDVAAFGRGYGEECDLCMRASRLGWRHVVAADLYVHHSGGRSFGAAEQALRHRNGHVLSARYPDYEAAVARFHAADPVRPARRALDFASLIALVVDPVLLVTLALPGGVERHVDGRRRSLEAAGHTIVELRPASLLGEDGGIRLRIHAAHLPNLCYTVPHESETLRRQLLELGITQVEVHHFLGLPDDVLTTVTSLGVPYRIFVHDHAWICPRINLLSGADRYCGEPQLALCEVCVREHGSAMAAGLTVARLRARSAEILGRAERVVAPSADTARRLARYFPAVRFDVEPWEILDPVVRHGSFRTAGPVRIALIGAIGIHKGYAVLLQCAADARSRELDLEFVVIGHTHADDALLDTGRVFITGPYADDEVSALLARECCDLAWFPSVTPETWCYALSHALAAGLPILAFDLGAIAERLRAGGLGVSLLPLDTSASRINDLLLHARADTVYKSSMPPTGAIVPTAGVS